MTDFELMLVSLAMYEGEDDAAAMEAAAKAAEDAAAAKAKADAAAVAAAAKIKPKVFSQDDVNKFLADDRRKHDSKYGELEGAYKEALDNQNLTQDQRTQLESKLEDLQKVFRSKEQQLEHDKKTLEDKYDTDIKGLNERATKWETKYKQSLIDRSLLDAAVTNEAYSNTQIVSLLRPITQMVEQTDEKGEGTGEYAPMVDLTDVDTKTGEQIITRRTPEDAVKRMKELPDLFGNLFRANVVSGVGAGSATGSGMPGSGRIDVQNMSPEQYMKMRQENPQALGLK